MAAALLCFVLCVFSSSFAVHLDTFPVMDPGEEFRRLTASSSDDVVFAATEHHLYRLSANLTELQRNLLTHTTRLLLLSNTSDALLVCGADCVLVSARNLKRFWPSPGDASIILDPATNGDVSWDGILRGSNDPSLYELTYTQDSFFNAENGEAVASRIVRGGIVDMQDTFEVLTEQVEQNPNVERRFLYVFSRGGFSYYVFIASGPNDNSIQARVARICDSDTGFRTSEDLFGGNFTSYIELGLLCGDENEQPTSAAYVPYPNAFGYDALVLSVGVERLSEVRNRLCAFRMPRVDEMMRWKIDECAGGVGVRGLERDGVTEPCARIEGERLCGLSPLEVNISYSTDQFLLVSGLERETESFFSQLTLTTVDGYTFLFAGNGDGEIYQFAILEEDAIAVRNFPADENESEGILDLLTSSDGLHIYFSTELAVYRYSLDICESYKTCEECSQAGDLFCGWCTLEHKCTRRGRCGEYWVDSEGCAGITTTEPAIFHIEDLQAESVDAISLTTANLPDALTRLQCVYTITKLAEPAQSLALLTDDVILANGSRTATNKVNCLLPDYIREFFLNTIASSGSSILSFRIGLESGGNGVEFVTAPRDNRILNCSNFQTCGSCMTVEGHCRWCPLTFSCHLITEIPICTEGEVRRESDCPALLPPITPATTHYTLHVNLPVRLRPQVLVRAQKLGPLLSLFHDNQFQCVVCREGCVTDDDVIFRLDARAVATSEGNTLIDCLGETFYDLGELRYLNAVVKLVYEPLNTPLDSVSDSQTIILYTCGSMGEFCTECLSLDTMFDCNYCVAPDDALLPSNYQCRLSSTCDTNSDPVTAPAQCSGIEPPQINSISPSAGPVEGGTSIAIVGQNLGVERGHIVDVIIGNNTICDVTDYEPGRRVVCVSRRGKEETSDRVSVTLSYQNQHVVSTTNFSFTQPRLGSPPVIPNMGPRSGGTPLIINGTFLNIGTTRRVQIGDDSTCDIISISSQEITCVTRPQPNLDLVTSPLFLMTVSIDGWSRTTITYSYTSNPEVDSVTPLSSIASGGTTYIVEGKELSIAQIRHMVFYAAPSVQDNPTNMADSEHSDPLEDDSEGSEFSVPSPLLTTDPVTRCVETWDFKSEVCRGNSNQMLACLAPPLLPGRYYIGLLMDAACHLLDLKMAVTVYEDPVFIPFTEPQTFSETEFLKKNVVINIKGERFNFASRDLELELEPCDSDERCLCEVLPLNTTTKTDDIQCVLAASNLQALPRDQPITMTAKLGHFREEIGDIMITSTLEISQPQSQRDVYIATGVAAFVVLLLAATVVAGAILTYRWRESKRMKEMRMCEEMEMKDHHLEQLVTEFAKSLPPKLFIHAKQLKIVESVGQGEYGIVYKAHLTRGGLPKLVAVKTVKGFVSVTNIQKMMEEIVIMQQFNHTNVLRLLGVVVVGLSGPSIVMPFMANGNLGSYLKKNQETVVLSTLADSERVVSARKLLLDVCLQIARGMQYLSDRNFIHRDLAARNCMIDGDGIIKVADFGLAVEESNAKGYFRQDKSEGVRLPFKWMALESLQDGVFTAKSDVWSYGVTMWEVFSGGQSPYPGVEPHTLPKLLQHGHRLEMPSNAACSEQTYSLMHQCWSLDPETRPLFSSLVADLTTSLTAISDYLTLDHDQNDCSLDNTNTLRPHTDSRRYVADPTLSLPRGHSLPRSYGYVDVTNDNLSVSSRGNSPIGSCHGNMGFSSRANSPSGSYHGNNMGNGSRGNSPTDSCSIIVMVTDETQSISNQPFDLVVENFDTTDEDISTCGFR